METFTDTLTGVIESAIHEEIRFASVLAMDPRVRDLAAGLSSEQGEKALADCVPLYPLAEALTVYNISGQAVFAALQNGKTARGIDLSDREYVKKTLAGETYTGRDVIISRTTKARIFTIATPIRNDTGTVVGGIAIMVDFSKFSAERIDPVKIGQNGYPYILDERGVVIAHPNEATRGKDVSAFDFVQASLRTDKGTSGYVWEGQDKVQVWRKVPATGWVLVASAYDEELAAAALSQRNMLIAIGVVGALALLAALYFGLDRMVLRPVQALRKYALAVEDGDYNVSAPQHLRDELGALRDSMQSMVAEIKSKLSFSQGVLNSIASGMPCLYANTNDAIEFVNDKLVRALGHRGAPESFKGMPVGQFIHSDAGKPTTTGEAMRSKTRQERELRCKGDDGAEQTYSIIANPIHDLDGNISGVFTFCIDLTDIRTQQEAMARANEKIRRVAREITQVGEQVSSAATEISAQVEEAARGAEVQASRVQETAASMQQMTATVLDVAQSASKASESTETATATAKKGEGLVRELVSSIGTINSQVARVKDEMGKLGAQAQGIGQVITVIQDIADQTNLLALNAAIEAARAGDAGRGFAVVADEVRKLAEKTMHATREVSEAVGQIQNGSKTSIQATEEAAATVTETTGLAGDSGNALREIVDIIEGVSGQVQAIAAASEEQSASSEAISLSIEDVRRIAEETSVGMDQSSAAVAELAGQAQTLQQLIRDLTEE